MSQVGTVLSDKFPLVTLILPVHDAKLTLERCMRSVFSQTYPKIELIIIDDGSGDGSEGIIDSLAPLGALVVRNASSFGVHASRISGMQKAKGKYVAFVDADDWLEPDMIYSLVELAESTNSDIAMCEAWLEGGGSGKARMRVSYRKSEIHEENILPRFCGLYYGPAVLWNKIYHYSLWDSMMLGADGDKLVCNSDVPMNFGAFANARRVAVLKKPLYHYCINPNSLSRKVSSTELLVRLFIGCAACLKIHGSKSDMHAEKIIDLYEAQIAFKSYRVSDIKELSLYREQLVRPFSEITQIYFLGLYRLFSAHNKANKKKGFFSIK